MFEKLDPLLHSQLRLAVMSLLVGVKEAEFNYIKEKTGATAGNLSVQLNKLKDADYISITKEIVGSYPRTTCKVLPKGRKAFSEYVNALSSYIHPNGNE
ncbi:MAG: transcriptional regulator [Cyclobacteriaceae bacterium]|nr:transcriptional regulator [Cyclobacteriaceae bacterium]MCH8514921.1 transcriptional regulator [Cyclobacteriaceae bacterium]